MGLHQHHCCSLIHIATLGADRDSCAKKIMEVEDFSSTIIFSLVILSIVTIFAVLGNGFVLGIIARFKKLRTFPNILISNLALVDFFQRTHQRTFIPALGCLESQMVYREDTGDYLAFSAPPLYVT